MDYFRKGYTVPQIAEARGLVTGTITSHLLKSLSHEEVGQYIEKFVAPDVRRRMERYLASTQVLPNTWTELRDAMGGAEWEDLHFLMKYYNRDLTPAPKPASTPEQQSRYDEIMSDLMTVHEPDAPYGSPADFLEQE